MIVTVGGTKGGSGKTTTATNLAVCALRDNKTVLLVDADPQGSSLAWRQVREEEMGEEGTMSCVAITAQSIAKDLPVIARNFDMAIVDVGGRDSNVLRAAMTVSDLFITPTTPAIYDLWAVEDTLEIIREARSFGFDINAYLLFNQVLPQKTILEGESREFVEEMKKDIEKLKSVLHARQDFKNSAANGMGCIEHKPKSAAAEECNVLYAEICSLLRLC